MDELLQGLVIYAGEDYTEDMLPFFRTLLDDALEEVTNVMYPMGFANDDQYEKAKQNALHKHKRIIRKIAEYHFDKQGKEGVLLSIENGVHLTYEKAGTPSSYLSSIMPVSIVI